MTHTFQWRTFAEALPEEGQAIVAVDCTGDVGAFRVVDNLITDMTHDVDSGDQDKFIRVSHMRVGVAHDYYPLWAPLPEGFKLWGEE